ncbi:MAG: alcohol dehydrogenase [Candidatus Omnitrophica bacterium CG11_big_fil_rev_8_21_14_0_20_45_26]|uniref:Alcohol dehydrogenase n=1 Tax=Candidatus Abzuiibacterium crystallinum TaxID=1974748 RepID=A0A2H0LMA9_9BACT|nr:MAG: alcohol dehydrogenase [Candidatus Omnitrophica bacterium CG11_big_fil_rev_8_21_14_0_20_45_26]PIW63647.1 MAG: alcohol dehydrogenase [Candidatus Omnitrophica bacterium CG12_big_fil_rev_8_21_14_0_65_45_16]
MQAVIIQEHGGPEKLTYTEVPMPKIDPDEVLIKVHACALNHLDIWTRQGLPGVQIPMPHILGCDIMGEIAAKSEDTQEFQIGERVIVSPGLISDEDPLAETKWESLSSGYQIIGFQIDGGYAEYVKVPVRNVIPVSNRLKDDEWAALPLVFLTAWHMLVTRAAVQKGETVLIHAAGSGVGTAGIQVAKHLGACVITTAGTDEKLERAKEIGADFTINYKKKDFADEVRRLTNQEGVDVVLEHIGPETFVKSLASLKKKGRLVTCGATSGPNVQLDLRFIFMRQLAVMGCYMGGIEELREVVKLAESGVFKPVVDKVFPLKEARAAHERMQKRENCGKIVLKI